MGKSVLHFMAWEHARPGISLHSITGCHVFGHPYKNLGKLLARSYLIDCWNGLTDERPEFHLLSLSENIFAVNRLEIVSRSSAKLDSHHF